MNSLDKEDNKEIKKVKKEMKVVKAKRKIEKSVIWIGPDLKKFGIAKNRIFRGDKLPKHIEGFLEKYKAHGLLVDINNFSTIASEMKNKNNRYAVLATSLLNKIAAEQKTGGK